MIQRMLATWSLVPLPFETTLNIWKFTVHVLLKPGLENFEHHFTSVWDECNCAVVWAFFGTAFLWNWKLIRILQWFCHVSTWISHGCTCVPHPEAPPTSVPTLPLWVIPEHQRWMALLHALNLHWSSISHMVVYMFQCYSLMLSHPRLLPESKVCSVHLCLFCCLAYRVIITIFLNSIYMR